MTTTMVEMEKVVEKAKGRRLNCKVIIGGAVITEHYAKEIGQTVILPMQGRQ